jgi:hypothetical protein
MKTELRIEKKFCERCQRDFVAKEFENDKLVSWQRCPYHDPAEEPPKKFKSKFGVIQPAVDPRRFNKS